LGILAMRAEGNMTDGPSDEIDTIAYAVSYHQAAELIAKSTHWTDNHGLIVPFFALIGFALENGLKAVLEHRKVDRSNKWFHSHDLIKLRNLVREQGLWFLPNIDAIIEEIATQHQEHHFRYPQKAKTAKLSKPPNVALLTDAMLRMVFDFIDGHQRID
jgi:hypothetical protein